MSLSLRWVGTNELDRVAQTRMLCYAHARKDSARFRESIRCDPRAAAEADTGDYLLAEKDGIDVGTLTHLNLHMWMRGARLNCQGIAYVGTVKTARRAAAGKGAGVASQLMHAGLGRARERGDVVTALMPFRGSYYEHFGYGFVETRHIWTIPLSILPTGLTDGIRFLETADEQELVSFRNRVAAQGQCDLERPAAMWPFSHKKFEDGFEIVDRPSAAGPVRGYLSFVHIADQGQDVLKVMDIFYEDGEALRRQLHFLASLKDQYSKVVLTLPSDLPLPSLLKESQLPHRPVNHATAKLAPDTRLQLRVLDHKRLLESMHLPGCRPGRLRVAVSETEGVKTNLHIEFSDGRAIVRADAPPAPEFSCTDRTWAAIVTGEIAASRAVRYGLAQSNDAKAVELLDIFATSGPRPFCAEAF